MIEIGEKKLIKSFCIIFFFSESINRLWAIVIATLFFYNWESFDWFLFTAIQKKKTSEKKKWMMEWKKNIFTNNRINWIELKTDSVHNNQNQFLHSSIASCFFPTLSSDSYSIRMDELWWVFGWFFFTLFIKLHTKKKREEEKEFSWLDE